LAKKLLILLCFLFFISSRSSFSSSHEKFLHYPSDIESNDLRYFAGLAITNLPKSIGEDMVQQFPMINIDLRYGILDNVSATSNLRTAILTNIISAGITGNYDQKNTSVSLGANFRYWYGTAIIESANASANGYMIVPSINIGINFDKIYYSIRTEAEFSFYQSQRVSDIVIDSSKDRIIGFSSSLNIEQPFYNDNWLHLGFKMNYTNYHYPSWIAFRTTRNWIFIPEFLFGVSI